MAIEITGLELGSFFRTEAQRLGSKFKRCKYLSRACKADTTEGHWYECVSGSWGMWDYCYTPISGEKDDFRQQGAWNLNLGLQQHDDFRWPCVRFEEKRPLL